MKIDARSKKIFIDFLKSKGFTNIKDTDEISEYYRFDIYAEFMGKRCYFELKDRRFKHTAFGDILCSRSKAVAASKFFKAGRCEIIKVVNFFTDDVLAISDIALGKTIHRMTPKTSYFADQHYEEEALWTMPQMAKFDINNFRRIE